jgi:uncharacterized membrane protein
MNTDKKDNGRNSRARLITTHALLCAIIVIFMIFPAIGPVKLAFIPIIAVVVSSEILGLKHGVLTGLFFGLVSFAGSYISPSLLSQAFHNPLISVAPRILIGVSAYYAGAGFRKLFPKAKPLFSYAFSAAAAVVTNTAFVLGMILAFHFGTTFSYNGTAATIGWPWLSAILLSNFLIELASCMAITPPVIAAIKKTVKK